MAFRLNNAVNKHTALVKTFPTYECHMTYLPWGVCAGSPSLIHISVGIAGEGDSRKRFLLAPLSLV